MDASATAENADDGGGWVTLKGRRKIRRQRSLTNSGFVTPRSTRSQDSTTTAGTNKITVTPKDEKTRGKGRPRKAHTASCPAPSVRIEDESPRQARTGGRKVPTTHNPAIGNLLKQALAKAATGAGDTPMKGQQQNQKSSSRGFKQRKQVSGENKAAHPVPARVAIKSSKNGSPWGKKAKVTAEKPRARAKKEASPREKKAEEEEDPEAEEESLPEPPATRLPKGFAVPKGSSTENPWGKKKNHTLAVKKDTPVRKKENKAGTPTPTRLPAATPDTKSESQSRDGSHPPSLKSSGPKPVVAEKKVWPTISPKATEPRPVEKKASGAKLSPRRAAALTPQARQKLVPSPKTAPPKKNPGGQTAAKVTLAAPEPTAGDKASISMNWAFKKATASQPLAQATAPACVVRPSPALNPFAKEYVSPREMKKNKDSKKTPAKSGKPGKKKGGKKGKAGAAPSVKKTGKSSPLSRDAKAFQPKMTMVQNAGFPTHGVMHPPAPNAWPGAWVPPQWAAGAMPSGGMWPAGVPPATAHGSENQQQGYPSII